MKKVSVSKIIQCGLKALSLSFLFFSFVSCGEDSGLGASIDTKAPTLSIDYPPSGAAIRDSFILAGSCSDDKSISRVVVSVKNLDTSVDYGSYSATVSSNQTSWQLELNSYDSANSTYCNGWQYPDGKYEFTVTAFDNAGNNSGSSSRQFEIDNTAPVFIISNPGVVKSNNKSASAYGSLFTIDGTISDNHTISLMDVKIYSIDGTLVSSETYEGSAVDFYREEDIATAGGSSVTIAQYSTSSEKKTVNTRYSQLHPSDSGTEYYYAEIAVYDSTQIYKNPPVNSARSAAEIDTDSYGNATSKVYLYDDVYTSLMSAKKGLGLSASDLKDILAGLRTDEKAVSAKTILSNSEKNTSLEENHLYFSLNPEANPTYTISGYTFGFGSDAETESDSNKTDVIQSASNGNTVNVTVTSGLDGVKVDPSTLKLWMYACDGSEKPSYEDARSAISSLVSKVKLAEAAAKKDGAATITDSQIAELAEDNWTLVYDYYEYNGSTVDVKSIAMTLPASGIVLNKYYILAATGYDADDIEFSQSIIYGFAGNVSGIAPTIEILTPDNGDFVSADTLEFTGTALVNNDSLHVSTLKATIYAWNGSVAVGAEDGYAVTLTYDSASEKWTSTNSDAFGISGTAWTFKPSAIDGFLGGTGDATKYTLSVYGESSSGHSITMSSMVQLDTTAPVVKITSVTPTVSGSDASDVVKASSGYADDNVYVNGAIRIMGSIVEQNLAEVTYDIWASADLTKTLSENDSILEQIKAATENNPNIPAAYDGSLGSSNSIDVSFMTSMVTQGMISAGVIAKDQPIKIRVVFTATDEVGNTGTYSSDEYNGGKDFIIYQETDRPQISFGNASEDVDSESKINSETNLFLTTNNKLSVTFSDDDGIYSYGITVKDSVGNELDEYSMSVTPSKSFTSGSKTLTLPIDVGIYKVTVTATDVNKSKTGLEASGSYGEVTSKEFYVAIDNGAPTVSVDSVAAYLSPNDTIKGSVTPTVKNFNNGTSLSSAFLDSDLNELASQPASLANTENGSAWSLSLGSMPSATSGSYILRITATDKYGQKGSATVKFGMDPIAPTISDVITAKDVYLDESEYVSITANVSDDEKGSGIASFGYYLSTSDTAPEDYASVEWTSMNQGASNWNATVPIKTYATTNNCEDGTVYIYYAAKDNAGNTTISTSKTTLSLDKEPPALSVNEFAEYVKEGETLTISGSYSDSHGIAEIKASATKDGASVSSGYSFNATDGTFTITVTSDGSNDGTWVFGVTAKDNAGRTTELKNLTSIVDTKKPVWKEDDATSPFKVNNKAFESGENHSWYNSSSLPFQGAYSEEGSGINLVYYSIISADGSSTVPSGSTADNPAFSEDYSFSTKDAGSVETFKANIGDFTKYVVNGSAVANKIFFKAVDNAGNESEVKSFEIYIDNESPNLESDNSGTVYSKKTADIEVNGTMSDDSSGVASVVLTVSDTASTSSFSPAEITATCSDGTWNTKLEGGNSGSGKLLSTLEDGHVYAVKATVTDKAGNSSSSTIFKIQVDTTAPTIGSNVTIEDTSDSVDPYYDKTSGKYYINNESGNKITISGSASDAASGVDSVKLVVVNTADSSKTLTPDVVNNGAWTFSELDMSGWTGGATVTITATDAAGNTSEEKTLDLVFDNAAPLMLHKPDAKNKDIYFRVGENDNDKLSSDNSKVESGETWSDTLDKDVGGKYSYGTFGNANTIKVRGTVYETGSGVNMIYYKQFTSAPSSSDLTDFLSSYEDLADGYFGLLKTAEKRRVTYNTDSGKKSVEITSNFKTTIADFKEESNYLVFAIVDNVGNVALDELKVNYLEKDGSIADISTTGAALRDGTVDSDVDTNTWNASSGEGNAYYAINVDTVVPTIETNVTSNILTNASLNDSSVAATATVIEKIGDDYVISGKVTDSAAGIRSLVVDVSGKTITKDDTTYGTVSWESLEDSTKKSTEQTWTVTLKKALFSSGTTTYPLYLTATDDAGVGNSQKSNVATIVLDVTAPTVTLTAPSDADTSTANVREINGTIDLSGTVSDENTLPEEPVMAIQWAESESASTWTDLTVTSITGNYSYTVTGFDTTQITDESTIYLRAKAKDQAGNIGYSTPFSVKVSQDTDRPVIKITNLTDLGESASPRFVLKYGTKSQVIATVTDDDGIESASDVVISEEKYTGSGSLPANSVYSTTNGTVTFTPSADNTAGKNVDGQKTFYIYVKDAAGKVFYTTYKTDNSASDYLNVPKVKINDTPLTDEADAAVFTYQSDSTSPTVEYIQALAYKSDGTTMNGALNEESGEYSDYENVSASYVIGGTEKQKAKFFVTASDASGIDGIALEIAYTELDGSTETAKTLLLRSKDDSAIADENYTVSGTFTQDSNDATKASWTTDIIDFSKVKTGSVTVKVIPYDKLGLVGNGNATFAVDNSGPAIKISSPASGEECTGEVTVSGTAIDDGSAGTADIQWIVPTNTERTTAASKTSDEAKLAYLASLSWNGGSTSLSSNSTVSAWIFDFDGNYDNATSTPASYIFKAGNPKLDVYDSGDFAKNSDYATSGLYLLPVYFMATDNLGNRTVYESYTLSHNPDADKPKIEFTYPTKKDYDSEENRYVTLGGTIRVTGSAVIPSGTTTVDSVYVQVASSSASFTGTAEATTEETDSYIDKNTYGLSIVSAYDVLESVLGSSVSVSSDSDAKKYGFASKAAMDAWWGIKTNGKASWNIALNSDGKMDPKNDSGTTNDITIRACGVNAEGKFGAWTTGDDVIAIHIDNAAPTMTAVVNQYGTTLTSSNIVSSNAAIEASSSQTYESDMYLRGQWYLVLDILDETGVSSLTVKDSNSVLAEGTGYYVATINDGNSGITDSSTNKKGRKVFVPISSSSASVSYTVTAVDADATGHSQTTTFSFNIDNDAPSMENITANGSSVDSTDFTSIEDSNYQFILSGSSTDEGSGVEHVLFYYMRKNGTTGTIGTNVVMDPMITSGTENSKVLMTSLTERTFTQESETFTLYAKAYSGSATTETFTSDSAYDAHVRVGGLVEIDGILHTISDISGNTVTFSPSLTAAKTAFTAYFPIAQVIDNSATEKVASYSANPFTFEKGDDGDSMPESFSKSGKTWTWDATIHSTNMPDGPVSLVILAFDNAGNVAGKTINTTITNNAPRLAKVFLGTDLSGDGKYVNSSSLTEIVEYDILGAEGATQKAYTLDFTEKQSDGTTAKYSAGTFKIKNGLAVIPELTGGNGNIGMVLKTGATSATAVTGTVTNATSSSSESADSDGNISASFTGTVEGTFKGSNASYKMHAFTVASGNLGSDGTNKGMSFTFWDSTEETTRGTDSQYSVLYVKNFTVAQTDSTKPTVVVNPFYWNSSDDNSLYGNSSDNGHIELEGDLTDSIKTAYGSDPKVSGKITFTGTAYDEHRLASLAAQFGTFLDSETTVATYNASAGSWTVASKTMDSEGYEFTVKDATSSDVGNYGDSVYFDQKGHKVYWTLSIDTSKITTVAETDVKVTVTATDASSNSTDTSSITAPVTTSGYTVTDGTTNYPVYQMDVVPYVAKVYTKLAKNKVTNWSVYNRTALGHYPVQSVVSNIDSSITLNTSTSENVTLYGFNLNDSSAKIVSGSNTFTVGNATTALAIDKSTDGQLGFNVAKLQSGELNLTVNGITILNNMNDNNSKGDASEAGDAYKNWYNRKGNGDTNNILTDDVYFDVWEFNDRAAVPINGTATGINMEINQKTGMLNYAFANGGVYYSMGGNINNTNEYSTTNSYSSYYWAGDYDTFAGPCVGFHVDDLGYTYSVVSGGDTNTSGSVDKWVLYSSRWGILGRNFYGTLNGNNSLRLEEIALKLGYHKNNLNYSLMKYRYLSPEFASTVSGTNTNLYLVYYDALCNQIRFRAGTFSTTSKETSGGFQDEYTGGASSYYSTNNCQIIANGSSGGEFKIDDAGNTYTVPGISGRGAGQYVDVAVVKNGTTDVVCVVWYDAEENNMKFSYISDPIVNWDTLKGDATAENWSTPQTIFTEGGEYCHIVADKNNHLHIAAYAGNGDVMYAFLDSYTDTAQTCTVDASGAVGEHLTLDVAVNSKGNSIPYIGYYTSATKMPKYAYLVDPTVEDSTATFTQVADGADSNEQFTGAWEVSVVPSPSRMTTNREDKVNIGIWKNAGVLTASTTGTSQVNNSGTGYTSVNWSKTFGNGTANGILGYQVSTSSGTGLETAQMR